MAKSLTLGQIFGQRLRAVRQAQGWSQKDVETRLRELGADMDRATIAKLELARRRATIDELFLFSLALQAYPFDLLRPPHGETVAIARERLEPDQLFDLWSGMGVTEAQLARLEAELSAQEANVQEMRERYETIKEAATHGKQR